MIKSIMKISITIIGLSAVLFGYFLPYTAFADEVLITPMLLEFNVEARDIITKDVTISNKTSRKVVLFATVNEVAIDSTGEIKEFISPVLSNRKNTVTSWIEVTRGRIELEPGEVKIIPVTARIDPYVEFGDYFALVGFVEASKRPDAEAAALRGDAEGVILKVAIADTSVQSLRVVEYTVDRFIFDTTDHVLSVEIENTGTKESVPTGEVIFYNSRGEEVSAIPFNQSNQILQPGETTTVGLSLPFGDKLGRFKANLTLQIGDTQQAAAFNTIQFYMIPFKMLIMIIFGILATTIIVTFLIRRILQEERHDDYGNEVPVYVRSDRKHTEHEHDIHITK
jgi:hypothetical protein